MEREYLIDSNAVIDYLAGRLPASGMDFLNTQVDKTPSISVITQIEILGFNSLPEDEKLLRELVSIARILPLDFGVVERTIALRKAHRIKTPDAVIAATAMEYDLVLITRNLADFRRIKHLDCLNPHEL